jgi:hypothetical protein
MKQVWQGVKIFAQEPTLGFFRLFAVLQQIQNSTSEKRRSRTTSPAFFPSWAPTIAHMRLPSRYSEGSSSSRCARSRACKSYFLPKPGENVFSGKCEVSWIVDFGPRKSRRAGRAYYDTLVGQILDSHVIKFRVWQGI